VIHSFINPATGAAVIAGSTRPTRHRSMAAQSLLNAAALDAGGVDEGRP
jgi:hypothetical protein